MKEIRQSFSQGSDNWPVRSRSGSGKLVRSPGPSTGAEFSHIKRS